MAPSNAAWGYGSRVRFPSPHLRLSQEERAAMIALSTLYLPISIVRGAGIGTAVLWKLTRLGGILLLGSPDSSPGGGGPGQSLTSTNPPPSIEEVGDLLMEISKTGRGYGFDIMKSRTSNGRRCPPGYRWDKKRRKCVRIRKY